jgi:hypothetical protein
MTSMEAYFPGNNSWVEKAPMPVRQFSCSTHIPSTPDTFSGTCISAYPSGSFDVPVSTVVWQ